MRNIELYHEMMDNYLIFSPIDSKILAFQQKSFFFSICYQGKVWREAHNLKWKHTLCKVNYLCSSLIIREMTSEENEVSHRKLIDIMVGNHDI
jgi:hypothetical protein